MNLSSYLHAYEDKSTDAMLEVIKQGEEDLANLLPALIKRRDAAQLAGNISLPFKNERGEYVEYVDHGARNQCNLLADAYQQMIDVLSRFLDDNNDPALRQPPWHISRKEK